MEEDVKGEPDEPKRPVAPRKRGLGRGLGAILSAPAGSGSSDAYDEHLTLHDALTGLPNRTLLDDRLEEALASCRQDGASLAVLVVSLDGFSKVNELFGHRVGDGLLHDVAERMSATRRRSDTVARFAGDEFVVVCPYVGSTDLACRMGTRILEDVSRPTSVDGVEHRMSASIGIVVAEPADPVFDEAEDRETVELLLGDATLAMRKAKEEGGGSWRLFDTAMREDAAVRHQHRRDLRSAMEDGGLFLEYEPVVAVETGEVVGESALLAWRLPGSVVEGPGALLELVDEAGLAIPVRRWLLDRALSDLSARRSEASLPDDYRVWVKVSPSFVADTTLVESVDELTAKHRVPSSMLGLDIVEPPPSSLPAVDAILQALVVRDVALALDDFGARSSNLTLLQRLPICALRLAPEIVAALDDGDGQEGAALVRGLVGLGRALGLEVVAQGVESETELAALRALGCDLAQGPHLGADRAPESLWASGPSSSGASWAFDLVAKLTAPLGPVSSEHEQVHDAVAGTRRPATVASPPADTGLAIVGDSRADAPGARADAPAASDVSAATDVSAGAPGAGDAPVDIEAPLTTVAADIDTEARPAAECAPGTEAPFATRFGPEAELAAPFTTGIVPDAAPAPPRPAARMDVPTPARAPGPMKAAPLRAPPNSTGARREGDTSAVFGSSAPTMPGIRIGPTPAFPGPAAPSPGRGTPSAAPAPVQTVASGAGAAPAPAPPRPRSPLTPPVLGRPPTPAAPHPVTPVLPTVTAVPPTAPSAPASPPAGGPAPGPRPIPAGLPPPPPGARRPPAPHLPPPPSEARRSPVPAPVRPVSPASQPGGGPDGALRPDTAATADAAVASTPGPTDGARRDATGEDRPGPST